MEAGEAGSVSWELYEGFAPLALFLGVPSLVAILYLAFHKVCMRPCPDCRGTGEVLRSSGFWRCHCYDGWTLRWP